MKKGREAADRAETKGRNEEGKKKTRSSQTNLFHDPSVSFIILNFAGGNRCQERKTHRRAQTLETRTLLGAPGLTTRNKKLLATRGTRVTLLSSSLPVTMMHALRGNIF